MLVALRQEIREVSSRAQRKRFQGMDISSEIAKLKNLRIAFGCKAIADQSDNPPIEKDIAIGRSGTINRAFGCLRDKIQYLYDEGVS